MDNSILAKIREKNGNKEVKVTLLLDSGNSCRTSSLSTTFYKKLKREGFLKNAKFFKARFAIKSANNSCFGVRKIMCKNLKFFAANNCQFSLDRFYIIDDLSTDVNISKVSLGAIEAK